MRLCAVMQEDMLLFGAIQHGNDSIKFFWWKMIFSECFIKI